MIVGARSTETTTTAKNGQHNVSYVQSYTDLFMILSSSMHEHTSNI